MAKWAVINNPLNSTTNMFGGKWGNDISRYLNGIDMGAIDSDKEPYITTNTRYGYGKLKMYDVDATHTVEFQTENITSGSNRVIKIRALVTNPDYIVTESQPATLEAKRLGTNSSLGAVLDADQNSIIRIDTVGLRDITGDNVNLANISGTGANSTINILKNYAGVLGATDIKVQFGESSKINSFEWFSTIPGPSTKLFDILPNQINAYTDLDMNEHQILNYTPDIPADHIMDENIAAHTSTKITITDKNQLNANIVYNDQANTFGAHNQTFPSGNLKISGNGGFSSSIVSGVLAGNINITLPNTTSTLAITTDPRFTDSRTPLFHAASHKTGSDLIRVNELAAPTTNNPSTNATLTANGTLRMLSGDENQFLNGVGVWAIPEIPEGNYTGNIKGNTATASGNGTAKIFTIAHGLSTTPASAIVKPSSIDAFGEFVTTVDATNITITYQVAPPGDGVATNLSWQWIAMDPAAHQVVNSYSTVGGGVALTKTKNLSDLPFRSMIAGSPKITLTQNANDITFDIDEAEFTTERPPTAHADDHKAGGDDIIKINELAASTTNNTATNSTTTVNGTLPILSGNGADFLNGLGQWAVPAGSGGGGGGSSTASNLVGTDGYVGLFKQKTSDNLEFKSLNVGSDKLTITNDTANNQVVFDIAQENIVIEYSQISDPPTDFVRTSQGNIFGDFQQTFPSAGIKIMNPLGTFGTIIENSAINGANKSLTLPLITSNDTLVVVALEQTLLNKTLTSPKISTIVVGTETLTLPTATDQLVGRSTTDTLTNKTLTAPKIATISNNNNIITLPTTADTLVGRATTDTLTNKLVDLTNNTITDNGAGIGGVPIHNGTKYVNRAKGADGTFLGVQSGVVGYYTPVTGGGGVLPDGAQIPATGRWGALWGGTRKAYGYLDFDLTYDSISYIVSSSLVTGTDIYTDNVDGAIAEFKSTPIYTRQSNVKFKCRWNLKQVGSDTIILIGLSSASSLPIGGPSHDSPLNNAHGVMVTCSQDIESVYQISRNDGGASQVKVPTTINGNSSLRTAEFDIHSTNGVTVTLDGVVYGPYLTDIPDLTTPMSFFMHIESNTDSSMGLGMRYIQVTSL